MLRQRTQKVKNKCLSPSSIVDSLRVRNPERLLRDEVRTERSLHVPRLVLPIDLAVSAASLHAQHDKEGLTRRRMYGRCFHSPARTDCSTHIHCSTCASSSAPCSYTPKGQTYVVFSYANPLSPSDDSSESPLTASPRLSLAAATASTCLSLFLLRMSSKSSRSKSKNAKIPPTTPPMMPPRFVDLPPEPPPSLPPFEAEELGSPLPSPPVAEPPPDDELPVPIPPVMLAMIAGVEYCDRVGSARSETEGRVGTDGRSRGERALPGALADIIYVYSLQRRISFHRRTA